MISMSQIKVGDRIKVVRDSTNWPFCRALVGKVGTVKGVYGEGTVIVNFDDSFVTFNGAQRALAKGQAVYLADLERVLDAVYAGDTVVYTREGEGSVFELRGAKAKVLETIGIGYRRDAERVAVYGERAEVTEANAPLIKVAFESKVLSAEFQSGIWMLLSSFKKFVSPAAPNPAVRKLNRRFPTRAC